MNHIDSFKPFPLISGRHKQTIIGSLICLDKDPLAVTELVRLSDGDKMALEITTPSQWKPTDPTVVMIHGLCGSHESGYLIRITHKLSQLGIRSIRLNLRGCGSGKGLAKRFYHSGCSDDVLEIMKYLKGIHPQSPIALVGFSLGGNIALKMVGELKEKASALVRHIIAVSPPCDLKASVELLGLPKNTFYQKYFVRLLRLDLFERSQLFKDMPAVNLPSSSTIYEFDEKFLAPHLGYKSAHDYYRACSSKSLIPSIQIPCDILYSKDDPIIESTTFDNEKLPDNIRILKTEKGGHLGFLGSPFSSHGVRWMDKIVISWLLAQMPEIKASH